MQANSFTMSSYRIMFDNTLSPISGPIQISATGAGPILGNAGFPCWIDIAHGAAPNGDDIAYAINFGDIPATSGGLPDGPGAIVAVQIGGGGNLSLLPFTGLGEPGLVAVFDQDDPAAFPGDPNATLFGNHGIDIAVVDGHVYAVQPRVGHIGIWMIEADGTLMDLPPAGGLEQGADPFAGTNPDINNFDERCFINGSAPECALGSAQGVAGF